MIKIKNTQHLITIIDFLYQLEHYSFWRESDCYGQVELYLKEFFETEDDARKFGEKIAKDKKVNTLVWNELPDPWEDK